MIQATALSKHYGSHRVLDSVGLSVAAGERVALLGLNGAGKTTMMRCLMGLTAFDGTLAIAGFDVRRDPRDARAHLGYVPQRAPFFDGTLMEVVAFFAALREIPLGRVTAQLAGLHLSLDDYGGKSVRTLSGGTLQKALLALALAADIRLLLLDEPTANLDPRARREFLRALKTVSPDTTILMASHRLTDVEAVADRLIVLHDGRIVFDGSIAALRKRGTARSTLWIKVPEAVRERVRQRLLDQFTRPVVLANGAAVGLQVEHHARADVLVDLRRAGIAVEDFWTESPSLQELLEQLIAGRACE